MDEKGALADKLDAVGWGLLLIWVGLAFLADIDFDVGLLGVGVITLGVQTARRVLGLKLEAFWVVIGLLFVIGGIWERYDVALPLVPILLILAGLALLLAALKGTYPTRRR